MEMNNKIKDNRQNQTRLMIYVGFYMILTLVTSALVIAVNKDKKTFNNTDEEDITILSGTEIEEDLYDESDIITENLPYIRLNKYNEATGERYGLVVTNDGSIYKYSFIETSVDYPDTDVFMINQTLYFDNIVSEYGKISNDDLNKLKSYTESVIYSYATEDPIFDTVGNSISYTSYMLEDNIVLINSDGVKNLNKNTDNILKILAKYKISL